jgi:hypothetical protein
MLYMKVFGEIKTSSAYSRNIQFDKEYAERFAIYKQSGGRSFVVDFEFKIIPGQKDIVVHWIEDKITDVCIEYIYKGLENFIVDRNGVGIGIVPFEIVISNCIIHPADFDTQRFVDYTTKRMIELSFEIGKKQFLRMYDNVSGFEAVKTDSTSYKFTRASTAESTYTIRLPNRKKQKLILLVDYSWHKTFIKENYGAPYNMSIVVEDGYIGFKHQNHIDIVFEHSRGGSNAFISIIDGVKKFVDDVHDVGYDLGGFNIYIKDTNMEYPVDTFSEGIYWSLKELFSWRNRVSIL